MDVPADELARLCQILESLGDRRELLDQIPEAERLRLLQAAGALVHPGRHALKHAARARRRQRREARREHDASLVQQTGMRTALRASVYVAPQPSAPLPGPVRRLIEPRACYVCKADYDEVHDFYDSMCPPCAQLNYARRFPNGDLRDRVALVTGARIKIGFQTALILLRQGARVIVTSRFPRDAAQRFAAVDDFARFADRLHIYGLDLRHIPSVELFAAHVRRRYPHLDILINNAAQTVRRPAAFYTHLLGLETQSPETLPAMWRPLLADHLALTSAIGAAGRDVDAGVTTLVQLPPETSRGLIGFRGARPGVGLTDSARLSQQPCGDEDAGLGLDVRTRAEVDKLFPTGKLDVDLQQVDLRPHNSWRMTVSDVPTGELLEVHLVNAVAPFVLCARLRPLLARSPHAARFVVNVSAMEAQFSRNKKTDKHPHTNMAKAALNMLTRTSAMDYAQARIYMNSVDTGWVTDEDPVHHVVRKQTVHRFYPPLDVLDGAARVVDPIFSGLGSESPPFGLFFKDYRVIPW
jgi:NAD(P)-dependent dehydrogenase (short-subunit alcohol dehydrogenase family)